MVFSGRLTPQWSWHQPKEANSRRLELPIITNHDDNFKPTIVILLVRIKGKDLAPIKTKIPLPSPIYRSGFHVLSMRKLKAKVEEKSAFPPFFLPLLLSHVCGVTTIALHTHVCVSGKYEETRSSCLFIIGKNRMGVAT